MRTLIHECEAGTVKFRLPTINETTELMNFCKKFEGSGDDLGAITWFINNVGKYIVEVNLKFEEDVIDSFEKLNDYPELMNELILISNKIVEKALSGFKKKD
jgi:hypothetical protein